MAIELFPSCDTWFGVYTHKGTHTDVGTHTQRYLGIFLHLTVTLLVNLQTYIIIMLWGKFLSHQILDTLRGHLGGPSTLMLVGGGDGLEHGIGRLLG